MKKLVTGLLLSGALAIGGSAQAASIAANSTPISYDSPLGTLNISGQISGLAFYQSNADHAAPGDHSTEFDVDNAMITVSKTTGMFQFYIQGGEYSFPTVGLPYAKSSYVTDNSFGVVPIAYGKVQLTDEFSISAGKLPTLVGAELAFTPQNMNIERGLLWNQEPIVSRGVQVNYASGPLSVAVSWNDGSYTNVWNSLSGLISYALDSSNTLAFDVSETPDSRTTQGSQIYNLMYTYTSGPWTFSPYVQYQKVTHDGSEWGVAALAAYQFTPEWSLNGRVEYEKSKNGDYFGPLPYGPGSSAWSFTVTPTYQKGIFFARGELSYATVNDYFTLYGLLNDLPINYGAGFGDRGLKDNQFRAMLEAGIVF